MPCFLEVFCHLKPTKKHPFGGLGIYMFQQVGIFPGVDSQLDSRSIHERRVCRHKQTQEALQNHRVMIEK